MTTKILHIIQGLTPGGAARSMIGLAKYSSRQGDYSHSLASLEPARKEMLPFTQEIGMDVLDAPDRKLLHQAIEAADIVHLHWWNNPTLNEFLYTELPPMRLITWLHVAGYHPAHVITKELVDFSDITLACNPFSYEHPVFQNMPEDERAEKTGMVYDATDFERIAQIKPKVHDGFNVGYIGTVDFLKMHPNYVSMSAAIEVPGIRFVVCGGGIERQLFQQAQQLGAADRFDFLGYVDDISPVLEEMDVFGYPLCPETYAAAELVLQEAMYVGIPPVVFPYGGVKSLVTHKETGLIVQNEQEYKEAVEFLYNNPDERKKMGENARQYALKVFGSENAARAQNPFYEKAMLKPKRTRRWQNIENILADPYKKGARIFVNSIGAYGEDFVSSLAEKELEEVLKAEKNIAAASPLLRSRGSGGVAHYSHHFNQDGYLHLWNGLIFQYQNQHPEAINEFILATQNQCSHWRVAWYMAISFHKIGRNQEATELLGVVLQAAPDFEVAQELLQEISGNKQVFDMAKVESPFPLPGKVDEAIKPITIASSVVNQDSKKFSDLLVKINNAYSVSNIYAVQRYLEQAKALCPNDADGMLELGRAYKLVGQAAEALQYFQSTVNLAPWRMDALLEAIGAAHQAGDEGAFQAAYRQALRLNAGNKQGAVPIQPANIRSSSQKSAACRVSVIVSTYKSERFMAERLKNLEAQTIADQLEIIVIDSNSPENEQGIVEDFQKSYSNIRYIKTEERETLYAAWNRGIRMSQADRVITANADDRFAPGALELMLGELEKDLSVQGVYGDWMVTRQENDSFTSPSYKFLFRYPDFYPPMFLYHQITSHAVMLRRSVFQQIGYYNGSFKVYGDRDFMLRFSVFGFKAKHIPQVVGLFLDTPASLNRTLEDAATEYARARMPYTRPETLARLFGSEYTPTNPQETAMQYAVVGALGRHYLTWDAEPHNDYTFAAQMFQQALQLDPANILALNNMGILACVLNQRNVGLQMLSQALRLAPADWQGEIQKNINLAQAGESEMEKYQWMRASF